MATSTEQRVPAVAATARRIRPSHVVLAIWVGFAIVTAVSGVTGVIFGFHDDSPIAREVFGGIPGALKLAFYVVTPVMIVAAGVLFTQRVRNYERGQPDRRETTAKNVGRRLRDFRAGMYMQTLLRDPAAGVMHSMIYFGFLVLFGVTTVLEIDHQLPETREVPPRRCVPRLLGGGRCGGRDLPRRHRLGFDQALRTASLSHPHQDAPRACGDPRDVLRAGCDGIPHRDGAHRRGGTAGVREVVVHRLPAVGPH